MNAPLYLARSGRVAGGSLYNASNNGDYWSSTVYGLESAFGLYFNSSLTTPANNPSRYAESAPTNDRKFEIARIVCTFSRESDRHRTLHLEE